MQRNFLWNFYRPEDTQWVREAPGGAPRGAQPTKAHQEAQTCPSGVCPPWVPPGPPLRSINTPIFKKS